MICPRCKNKIPIKDCLYLSNESIITCKKCGARSKPQKMSNSYFLIAFVFTAVPAYFFATKYDTLPKGLLVGISCGIIVYGISVVYTYSSVKLIEI